MRVRSALVEQMAGYFRERAVIYALVVALLAGGVGVGAVAVGSLDEDDYQELSAFLSQYVRGATVASERGPSRGGDGGMLTSVARGVAVPWLLGLTIIGAPLALALVFLRGFAVGFTLRFLVEELSLKGVLFALVSVVPHSFFTLAGICIACGAALTFAVSAANALIGRRRRESLLAQFLAATTLSGAGAISVAAGAWIQANVTPVLVDLATRWVQF